MTSPSLTMHDVPVHLAPSPSDAPVEVVERKGLGHPDTLADALAERMSIAYSRFCLEKFGAVLHHNLDKLYLRGGHARTEPGLFEMTAPVTLTIGGRVSTTFSAIPIDHRGLFEQVAHEYLPAVLPDFDARTWLRIEHATNDHSRYPTWFHPRSLADLPELDHATASDTVAVTAWYPNTPTEDLVLALERHLNQQGGGPRHTHLGQDIKVMAARRNRLVDVTLNVPVHPKAAPASADYDEVLRKLHAELDDAATAVLNGRLDHRLHINSNAQNPFGGKRQYLLGSGSCLEFGEEGFVGRGNGASGLIPISRPKSVEAPFGKNPMYHAGKVYTIYANEIARALHTTVGVASTVTITACHSAPLRQPALVDIRLHADAAEREVADITRDVLDRVDHVALAVHRQALVPR